MHDPLLSAEVIEFRERYRKFIDEEVIPAEPVLDAEDEASAACMQAHKARAKGQ